jgi:hypothetical protein
MIVFDLKCGNAHVFEAWFASSDDFDRQAERGLIACPICADTTVAKAVMAPAIPAKGNRGAETPMASGDAAAMKAMLAKLAELQKSMTDSSEYVGRRFAEEARAMHHGETDTRGIYGETSAAEAAALRDEGIPALPLLFPVAKRSDA